MGVKVKSKLVSGVGINDADYPVVWMETIDGKTTQKMCPFYRTWKSMLRRCYDKDYRSTTYNDCSVCPDWLLFSNFKGWMEKQNYQGLHLDKDLLIKGNKIYYPEACVFVPNEINAQSRMNLKENCTGFLGVTKENRTKIPKYRSRVSGKTFKTSLEAHRAWQWERALQLEEVVVNYSKQPYFRTDVADALMARAWKLRVEHSFNIISKEV